jgi:hypothetical protein
MTDLTKEPLPDKFVSQPSGTNDFNYRRRRETGIHPLLQITVGFKQHINHMTRLL